MRVPVTQTASSTFPRLLVAISSGDTTGTRPAGAFRQPPPPPAPSRGCPKTTLVNPASVVLTVFLQHRLGLRVSRCREPRTRTFLELTWALVHVARPVGCCCGRGSGRQASAGASGLFRKQDLSSGSGAGASPDRETARTPHTLPPDPAGKRGPQGRPRLLARRSHRGSHLHSPPRVRGPGGPVSTGWREFATTDRWCRRTGKTPLRALGKAVWAAPRSGLLGSPPPVQVPIAPHRKDGAWPPAGFPEMTAADLPISCCRRLKPREGRNDTLRPEETCEPSAFPLFEEPGIPHGKPRNQAPRLQSG